jgi:hypothetical protein
MEATATATATLLRIGSGWSAMKQQDYRVPKNTIKGDVPTPSKRGMLIEEE